MRVGGLLCLIGAAVPASVLPFSPPTRVVGQAGWAVAAAFFFASVGAGAYLMIRPASVHPIPLLLIGYAAVVGLGLTQVLVGSQGQFELAFVLLAAYQASVHPARRVLPLLGCVVLVQAISRLTGGSTGLELVAAAGAALLTVLLAFMALIQAGSNRALAARVMSLREDAERRALTDPLTAVGNRRAFDEALARQIGASERSGRKLSLAMFDIDRFKSINDRFGHEAGDAALTGASTSMAEVLRGSDVCFRWGGDEFAVLLPDTGRRLALQVARRVAESVRQAERSPDGQALSISYGVATRGAGEAGYELVRRADAALFEAKRVRSPSRAKAAEADTSPV